VTGKQIAWALLCAALGACDSTSDDAPGPGPPVLALLEGAGDAELRLSETGLYADIAARRIAPDLIEFEPAHALWSDGLDKRRWLRLPASTRIDDSDMDHWQFPPGAMLFKEFSAAGRLIETRVIVRTGDGPRDYWMGAFVWDDDEADARFVAGGQVDARGTHHDVPPARQCGACHNGEPGRILGFSAVQQPDVAPELLDRMAPHAALAGDAVAGAALGHLHANCGHCHNPNGSARPDTDMDLRLSVGDRRVEDTGAYRTAVGRPLRSTGESGLRIAPGAPDRSGVVLRMNQRGTPAQMPPLGSEAIDAAGVDLVRAWIDSL
jgi:hypothetical protein